jgi:hypothetical protein
MDDARLGGRSTALTERVLPAAQNGNRTAARWFFVRYGVEVFAAFSAEGADDVSAECLTDEALSPAALRFYQPERDGPLARWAVRRLPGQAAA